MFPVAQLPVETESLPLITKVFVPTGYSIVSEKVTLPWLPATATMSSGPATIAPFESSITTLVIEPAVPALFL